MATTNNTSGVTRASYSLTLRVRYQNKVGMLGKVASTVGSAGGDIGAIDIVRLARGEITRDITINARDDLHGQQIIKAVRAIPGVTVVNVSDRTFLMHLGGKIHVASKAPVKTRDDLSMAYTPGVARVSEAIHRDPRKAFALTIKSNSVAIVTDGSAVLGLGDIGPQAALPVMEGKAMLFKEFANIDAFPICLATKDVEEIIKTVKYIAPAFGGINLEDISAPRCFEIESRLQEELDIPVFHDDQHGTAIVVLAALRNALKLVGKKLRSLRVVVCGAGAAGAACTKMLLSARVKDIIVCDSLGPIYQGRKEGMNPAKEWLSKHTNPRQIKGRLEDALKEADFFLGVSRPGLLTVDALTHMAKDSIIFALANPVPEIMPEEAAPYAKVIATGRSDYPNQINNVLCFPGLFRGVLDSRARTINEQMKHAAARAIASVIKPSELFEEYIIPSVFDKKVARAVAHAVSRKANETSVARRLPRRY